MFLLRLKHDVGFEGVVHVMEKHDLFSCTRAM